MPYRSSSVFSLGAWSPHLPAGLACPAVLCAALTVCLRVSHPLWSAFPDRSAQCFALRAVPLSLATTRRIVSVPRATWMFRFTRFPRHTYLFSVPRVTMPPRGFPHSDTSGCFGCTPLTGAFRSVPRPSSALVAQSSPLRPGSFSTFSNHVTRELASLALPSRFFPYAFVNVPDDTRPPLTNETT